MAHWRRRLSAVLISTTHLTHSLLPTPPPRRHRSATDRTRRVFGGASFGGIAALHVAQRARDSFANVLAESPSLWVAEGRYLRDIRAFDGEWPERMFVGVGTKEYSATRDHERRDVDDLLLGYAHECRGILKNKTELEFVIGEGAGHHEGAWAWRLPGAMKFLIGHMD